MSERETHKVYEFHTSLENYQIHKLNQMLSFLLMENEFYQSKLHGIQLPLRSKEDLAKLPFTTKQELVEDQKTILRMEKIIRTRLQAMDGIIKLPERPVNL